MILIYRMDLIPQAVSFSIQYKVNDNWNVPLYDVDIEVFYYINFKVILKSDVKYEDLKTIPLANSTQGNIILWKAK